MNKEELLKKLGMDKFKDVKSCSTCKHGKTINTITHCSKLFNLVVDTSKDMPCKGELWESFF